MFPALASEANTKLHMVRLLGTGASAPTKQLGQGITVSRTSVGLYKLTWPSNMNPGTFIGAVGTFGAATPGDVIDLKLIRDTYDAATKSLEILVAAPNLKGSVASSNPASIAAGGVGTATLTVTGVAAADIVMAHPRDLANGLVVESYDASGTDTITVRLFNPTAGAIDDVAQTWEYVVFKQNPTDLAANQFLDLIVAFKGSV